MKNKKTFVGIALLIVVLVLGIAYAAITDTLTIDGSAIAGVVDANFKVAFTGNTEVTNDAVAIAEAVDGEKTAELNVTGLKAAGETVTAKFEVDNTSNGLNADLAVAHVNDNTEYFEVTTSVENANIAVDGKTNVVVTVKLLKTPIEQQEANIDVTLTATAVVAD